MDFVVDNHKRQCTINSNDNKKFINDEGGVMPGSELIQSLVRGLDVLDVVSMSESGMPLKQIAAALDLKSTTVHNILRTLAAKGFIIRSESTGLYSTGPAVSRIASRQWQRTQFAVIAEFMEVLYREFDRAVVNFAIISGDHVVNAMIIRFDHHGVMEYPKNSVMTPYSSVSAIVNQAFWNTDLRDEYQKKHDYVDYGSHIWGEKRNFDTLLEKVRKQGYFAQRIKGRETIPVGVPVFTSGHEFIGVLALSLFPDVVKEYGKKACIRKLHEATDAIRKQI